MSEAIKHNKLGFALFFVSLLLLLFGYLFNQPLNRFYNEINHNFIHTVLELFSVIVCFSISLYGWKAFEDTKSKSFLWLPFIFLTVGVLDLFHLMTYPGMPFFITESSIEKSVWFWVAARITTSIGLLYLMISEGKETKVENRSRLVFFTCVYLLILIVLIYVLEKELPQLIVNEGGPTPVKNFIEYSISGILLLVLFKTYIKYKDTKQSYELELMIGVAFLLLSELTLTIYTNISDIYSVIGHLIKAFGYAYVLKAYFFSRLQLTFYLKQEAEKDLINTQGLLQSFFSNTPDSIAIMDPDGKVLAVNAGFEGVYGWKKEEVEGRLFRELMPNLKENIDKVIKDVSSGKNLIAYETIRQRKDGSNILINMTISPIINKQGKVVKMAAITRDITHQKEAELRVKEAERELKDTVRKNQGITFKFKKIEGKFIHTLCDGELLYVLKFTPKHIVGKDLGDFLSEELASFMRTKYEQAYRGNDITFEVVFGSRICVLTLKPIKRDHIVREVVGSCMDITQLKKTEELLQKSEKLAVVGELAAGLAHEIRNPLTTLKGFTQLIESQDGNTNKAYINLMLSELDRIELITNEFMAVAKPQAITFQKHDLVKLIKHIVTFSTPQALLKNIEIVEKYEEMDYSIICEGNQIKQVFINLIKNAIEAMPEGGRLEVMLEKAENSYKVTIKDNGVGIPKEILPKIGEPFYTLKEKGTGLGLMVSFRIIESHRGYISFDSIENEGTTVTITLPS